MIKNALAARTLPGTTLQSLMRIEMVRRRYHDPLAGLQQGKGKRRKERTRHMGEQERRDGKRDREAVRRDVSLSACCR